MIKPEQSTEPTQEEVQPDKTIKETLRYDFTDAELTEVAKGLGQKCQDKATLEEEKKRVASQYKLRIDTLDGEIEADTLKVNSGYEMRSVECGILFHRPKQGLKSILRLDTNEVIRTEGMSEAECQSTLEFEGGPEGEETPNSESPEGEQAAV